MATKAEITTLLVEVRRGDEGAVRNLFPQVYEELRQLAHAQLRRERPNHTLDTTALVHEVFLKMVDQTQIEWRDRAHFLALSSRAMRQILVDYARRRKALKRGGAGPPLPLYDALEAPAQLETMLVELDQAMVSLGRQNDGMVRVVECRFFGGMSVSETAEALNLSQRTVERYWSRARTYLFQTLKPGVAGDVFG